MMQLRNTPDPDCNVSPAMIVFGRPIRDAFAFINRLDKFSNHNIRPTWREAWEKKEEALRERFHKTAERLNGHARQLPDLGVGDRCYEQNQMGNHPKRWDRSGTVIDLSNRDSYVIKVDSTGRLTRRNRRFGGRDIPRPAESLLFFIEFRQKRTLKSRNKFNFLAAENSGNQSYCSLCVPTYGNSRIVRMIPSTIRLIILVLLIFDRAYF